MAESAASYISILETIEKNLDLEFPSEAEATTTDLPTAFSLAKFIPLLQERIHVISPFTRTFLVSWLNLLDTIPDLELISYLPAFLAGLIKFLGDPNKDVYVATQSLLDRFLAEIRRIARIKKGIEESKKSRDSNVKRSGESEMESVATGRSAEAEESDNAIADSDSGVIEDDQSGTFDGDWVPGQDAQIDYTKILEILVRFVDTHNGTFRSLFYTITKANKGSDEEMQLTALKWIDTFFEISPEDILQFVPTLLSQVLPAISSGSDQVRQAATKVNTSLMEYIVSLSEDFTLDASRDVAAKFIPASGKEAEDKRLIPQAGRPSLESTSSDFKIAVTGTDSKTEMTPRTATEVSLPPPVDLDYAVAVNSLTLQFLNENEATRVAALSWLIMLHRKAPRKVLSFNDGTFPALLKTLSDPAEAVVTKDLQLLSQISRNSEDGYFTSFMVNLLQLFSTDRKLLEVRGNLIIRQLCMNLSPERIYRTLADCLEKEEVKLLETIVQQSLTFSLGYGICQYYGPKLK